MSIELEQPEASLAGAGDYIQYRAMSTLAVISGVLGILSAAALLDWFLAAIPALGIVTGVAALARIRSRPTELTGRPLALVGVVLSALFFVAGLSLLSYEYATEVPPGYQRISYADLQPDDKNPGEIVPPRAIDLDGKKVFIKGYVYPGQQQSRIKQFILVRDAGTCCFGGQPKLTDMIEVRMAGSRVLAEYELRVHKLAGTFRVQPSQSFNGLGGVVYHLEADQVE